MKKPTKKEIDAEILRLSELRTKVPKRNFFGTDNHEQIDAAIEVLRNRLSERQIQDRWWADESAEEYTDGDNDLYHEMMSVHSWMEGDGEAFSEGWS